MPYGRSDAGELVLVVEDNEGLNHLICKKLQRMGYSTMSAQNGNQALEIIANNSVKLLLLDYKLPDFTGEEVVRSLMATGRLVPFVVMTGNGNERVAVEVMKLGARDYLIKSSDFIEGIPHIIERVMRELDTEMKLHQIEIQLFESEKRFRSLFENSLNGIAFHKILTNSSGEPIDYIFLDANSSFMDLMGLNPNEIIGKRASEILPGMEISPLMVLYKRVAQDGSPIRFEQYISSLNKHYQIVAFSPEVGEFITIFEDISDLRKAQETILEQSDEAHQIEKLLASLEERTEQCRKFMNN